MKADRCGLRCAVLLGCVALLAGGASAWWSARYGAVWGTAAGPWRVNLLAGHVEADARTRARVAVGGLLALDRAETMYYVATTDSRGQALRSRCHYRVSGPPPAARWWSLTAYADDFLLFDDALGRYSVNSATAVLDAQGQFTALTGPTEAGDGSGAVDRPAPRWLPTPGDRGLVLTLRVYNPAPELQQAPGSLVAPRIEPLGACS